MVYTHTKLYNNNEAGRARLSLKLDLTCTMKSSGFISSGGLDLFIIWTEGFTKSLRSWRSNGDTSAQNQYTGMPFSALVHFVTLGEFQKGLNAHPLYEPCSKSISASYFPGRFLELNTPVKTVTKLLCLSLPTWGPMEVWLSLPKGTCLIAQLLARDGFNPAPGP